MKCAFCTRQAVHVFDNAPPLCESCGQAYREGFEHGRVYESADRRAIGRRLAQARRKSILRASGAEDVCQSEDAFEVRQTQGKHGL